MKTSAGAPPRVLVSPGKRSRILLLAGVALGALRCAAPAPAKAPVAAAPDPLFCVGELCVHGDHVRARRTEGGRRCMVLAWDGDAQPPTAQVLGAERVPSRPGVLLTLDLPSLRDELVFSVAPPSDAPRSPQSAAVLGMRVDAFSQVSVRRALPDGQLVVTHDGKQDDVVLQLLVYGKASSLRVPKQQDGCSNPLAADAADAPLWPTAR